MQHHYECRQQLQNSEFVNCNKLQVQHPIFKQKGANTSFSNYKSVNPLQIPDTLSILW